MKILMVLTSHDQLGDTGKKTGFWLEEFAAPWYVLKDAGAEIVLASPKGGEPPLDPKSDEPDAQTDATRRFKDDVASKAALAATVPLSEIDAGDFDAVFYPGGHGPMWDLAEDASSIALLEAFSRASKPIAAVCHAPAIFRHTKSESGQPLVQGRAITGFTNAEEEAVGLTDIVPFLLEDMLKSAGAYYQSVAAFEPYIVVDDRLVTGQNPASSEPAAEALLQLLKA